MAGEDIFLIEGTSGVVGTRGGVASDAAVGEKAVLRGEAVGVGRFREDFRGVGRREVGRSVGGFAGVGVSLTERDKVVSVRLRGGM